MADEVSDAGDILYGNAFSSARLGLGLGPREMRSSRLESLSCFVSAWLRKVATVSVILSDDRRSDPSGNFEGGDFRFADIFLEQKEKSG